MRMCVLASGSSGNCTLVRAGDVAFFIDAGIGPRTAARRLEGTGAAITDATALLLTHLDSDHFKPTWFPVIRKQAIRVFVHERHVYGLYRADENAARDLQRSGQLVVFDGAPFGINGDTDLNIRTVRCPHDASGSTAYRIDTPDGSLAFATDVGRVNEKLIRAMTGADILAIESNYDPDMQLASARPGYLKRRIMGGRGHLSNQQAADAVSRAVALSDRAPSRIVLLHLSQQCNHPDLARAAYDALPLAAERLCVTSQNACTPWITAEMRALPLPGEQLAMW